MTFHIMWTEFLAFSPLGEKTTIIFVHWRERQVLSIKSEGLVKTPTRGNIEDETHLGVQHARKKGNQLCMWQSLWFHWVYLVDGTATVNQLGEESLV